MKCPICTIKRATSTHHVKPRDSGGSDNHRNKITLCRPCHDIVEDIYGNTGAELSPQVIRLIKLRYGFPIGDIDRDIDRSILETSLYRLRRKLKFARESRIEVTIPNNISLRCPHCRKWHYPDKKGRVICPELLTMTVHVEEIDAFRNDILEKVKKIRMIVE